MKQPLMTIPPAQAEALLDSALEDEPKAPRLRSAPLCWTDEDWNDEIAPPDQENGPSFANRAVVAAGPRRSRAA